MIFRQTYKLNFYSETILALEIEIQRSWPFAVLLLLHLHLLHICHLCVIAIIRALAGLSSFTPWSCRAISPRFTPVARLTWWPLNINARNALEKIGCIGWFLFNGKYHHSSFIILLLFTCMPWGPAWPARPTPSIPLSPFSPCSPRIMGCNAYERHRT